MTIVDPEKQLAGKFILALKQFSSVKDACFGQYLDIQNYENYIKQFMTTYRSLPISIPLKLHVLESHAVEFLKDMGEQFGLGFFSEQSFEAMHKKQKANWGTTPLREDHPEYGPKLKALVVNSIGKNLWFNLFVMNRVLYMMNKDVWVRFDKFLKSGFNGNMVKIGKNGSKTQKDFSFETP